MFDRLTDGFNGMFRKLSGRGTITESNIADAMADVRRSLIEADVHLDVVKEFIDRVTEDALGQNVTKSLKPGEEMIGIVHRRLIELFGGDPDAEPGSSASAPPTIVPVKPGPTVVMMCGLQGSGKTTTTGKLAAMLKKQGKRVMVCAADLQRPAAVEQLQTLATQVQDTIDGPGEVTCHAEMDKVAAYGKAVGAAVKVCRNALAAAKKSDVDVLILDTAGRLHINDDLMDELHQVRRSLTPHHIFLVVDAMTGQDAVVSAKAFHERLEVDGIVLTKFDSDTRGGAALSVKRITGAPIRYVGVGEKIDALEAFHPERMAGRILGMGDVVSLVEKAQQEVSDEDAQAIQDKMAKGELTMDDFVKQLRTLRRMGPMKQILGLLPGLGSALKDAHIDDKELDKVEAMISSMTPVEREKPREINLSRRRRIAKGSGTDEPGVGKLVKQFNTINQLTKQMSGMSASSRADAVRAMQGNDMGGLMPGMGLAKPKGSTKTKSVKSRAKQRKKRR